MDTVKIGDLVRYEPEVKDVIKTRAKTTMALVCFKGIVTSKLLIKGENYVSVDWIIAIDKEGNIKDIPLTFLPRVFKEEYAVLETNTDLISVR